MFGIFVCVAWLCQQDCSEVDLTCVFGEQFVFFLPYRFHFPSSFFLERGSGKGVVSKGVSCAPRSRACHSLRFSPPSTVILLSWGRWEEAQNSPEAHTTELLFLFGVLICNVWPHARFSENSNTGRGHVYLSC